MTIFDSVNVYYNQDDYTDGDFIRDCVRWGRNDPTLVQATAGPTAGLWEYSHSPMFYLEHMGQSLRHNTVVTKLSIPLTDWSEYLDYDDEDDEGATMWRTLQPVLEFMDAPSLQLVKIAWKGNGDFDFEDEMMPMIVMTLLTKVHTNRSIRALDYMLSPRGAVPLALLTGFLVLHTTLEALQFHLNVPDHGNQSEVAAAQALARTIRAHGKLRVLSLHTTSLSHALGVLDTLPTQLVELELHQDQAKVSPASAEALARLLASGGGSQRLNHIALCGMVWDRVHWKAVWAGLQANPSIASLSLRDCEFNRNATKAMLSDLHANDSKRPQHIRSLQLVNCKFVASKAMVEVAVAKMVQGSLLHRFEWTCRSPQTSDVSAPDMDIVFDAWAKQASLVRLQALQINASCICCLVEATEWLSLTVHLRHLTIRVDANGVDFDDDGAYRPKARGLPPSFLAALRGNGSLHQVDILDAEGRASLLQPKEKQFIDAVLTRNRKLSRLLTTPATPYTNSSLYLFPTLCRSATQARQMSATTLLQALCAAAELVGTDVVHGGTPYLHEESMVLLLRTAEETQRQLLDRHGVLTQELESCVQSMAQCDQTIQALALKGLLVPSLETSSSHISFATALLVTILTVIAAAASAAMLPQESWYKYQ